MVQADVDACLKDSTLIPSLATAGCYMIFFGIESLSSDNLAAAGKQQNLGKDLERLFQQCHDNNIIVHAAYMIGFPSDTLSSIEQAINQLPDLGADHVSFYIRSPTPGCEDWIRLITTNPSAIDSDYNHFDSDHCVTAHDLTMTGEQCEKAYQDAWRSFYTVANMVKNRQRFNDRSIRRSLLLTQLWYWWATRVERSHPMQTGFYRLRPYWDRRPGAPKLSLPRYIGQEIWRHLRYFGYWLAGFYLFQQVELETEYSFSQKKETLTGRLRGIRDWTRRTFGQAINRRWLNDFWLRYARHRWQLLNPWRSARWHICMLPYAVTEIVYTLRFACHFRHIWRTIRT